MFGHNATTKNARKPPSKGVKEDDVLFITKWILAPRRGEPRGAIYNRLIQSYNKRPMAVF